MIQIKNKLFLNIKQEKKMKLINKNNYKKTNKTKLKTFSNVRGQCLYSRGKSRCIILSIKVLNNDIRSDDTTSVIALLSDYNK